jgi:deazaflavin-dependent oxidoreductase (nitroreductase family)
MTTPNMTMSRVTRRVATAGAAMLRVRWFVRAPIWLYRARLGFLFGTRLLMLVHIGRTSGERRYVVLEVVARPTPNSYIVASGFGAKAQWFRNIVTNPHVTVYLGSHGPRLATARVLDRDHNSEALADYAAAHPRAWRTLRPVFETTLGAQIDDHTTSLPLVALELGMQGDGP